MRKKISTRKRKVQLATEEYQRDFEKYAIIPANGQKRRRGALCQEISLIENIRKKITCRRIPHI